ncbi:MAG TPA: zinc-binding dehydrogenase [Paracoccaceae bacterium]|nr:zinc-binding dehydrogenase [Paracoccaceae bacterium]
MSAVRMMRCHALEGPSALRLDRVARAPLGPGEVRVRVTAAGVNHPDLLMTEGRYQAKPEPPFCPGLEAAGVVVEGGGRFAPGARVIVRTGVGRPGFAEETTVPEAALLAAPEALSDAALAGFHVAHHTAAHALLDRGRLVEGETLLVFGAGAGVGHAAVAVGRASGARVVAAAGSPARRAAAAAAGAEAVIDSGAEDLRGAVEAAVGRGGVDVVFDPVGGRCFEAGLRVLGPEGRLLVLGFTGGMGSVAANYALIKEIEVIGVRAGSADRRRPGTAERLHARLVDWLAAGRLSVPEPETLPLERAAEALERLRRREVTGKLVLVP